MDHPIPTVRQRAVLPVLGRSARHLMLLLGFVCTAVGIAGLILPLLPGTVFLLIAAWAFSRSSERLHLWLFHHPRFGRTIRDWHYYRAIPTGAKLLAIVMMLGSFIYVAITCRDDWLITALVGATLALVAIWIATRPNAGQGRGVS
ncbi:MAG: YbaN family protein [Alphaproteobacteria bacterium]|jgi:hypothetical protein|nr:YbaN family protein [Alphaproteobacteria bacterium]MDP6253841.1 YbaN family protein [Alphaproteobacteria bacterium]MDP7056388.1 YbaN family protein [Alphaproteobacteria bacterium]MDP7230191.1 YbaN family protein [Alphaproteobacteria bacterium]MDP7460752.1 YbaN family protein [Alphaproteobacteria bacterium]|tara:strand:- start:2273 stop:2710 length:438 start_codon:yes stop_codon:yes gene_type:complete